jgi:hypothetical protein
LKKKVKFAGSKYAVYRLLFTWFIFIFKIFAYWRLNTSVELEIPKMTYVSAPMQIINAGNKVTFEDLEWSGVYQLKGSRVWDGAVRWTKDMYVGLDALQVVSFQIKGYRLEGWYYIN